MEFETYVKIFSSLLVPVIAIVTTYIAVQQYKINKFKVKISLYDRRLGVFNASMKFIAGAGSRGDVEVTQLIEFLADTKEADFLFEKDVYDHLMELHDKGARLHSVNEQMNSSRIKQDRLDSLNNEHLKLVNWFAEQFEVTRRKSSGYLNLRSLK